jgi:hypothetical protein
VIKRLILAGIIFLAPTLLIAEDIYVTQCGTATGVSDTVTEGTGAACNNAKSVTWFNTIGNWGAGAGKVSAGDTVHLCGTFTFPANGSYNNAADLLVIRGSGSEGSPVTILFETDTVVQSPQFSTQGGIICHKYMSCTSYVTIDGGTNGIIQNTNNGSDGTQGGVARNCTDANPCGIHASSNGLNISAWGVSGVDHIEVKNLTIRNIYLNGGSTDDATDSRGQSTAGINIVAPAAYISVHHNSVSNARTGIGANFSAGGSYNVTLDNLDVHHNYVADTCWGLSIAGMVGGSDPNWYYAYATNVFLHDNEITDWENWGWPAATYHLDGIITYGSRRTETPVYSPYIYNNYIHGKLLGGSPTAFIFCTYPGSDPEYEGPYPGSSCTMFNNLLVYHDNSSSGSTCIVALDHTANHKIYNNTCITAPNYTDHAIAIVNPAADPVNTGNVLKNNIVKYSAQMLDFGRDTVSMPKGMLRTPCFTRRITECRLRVLRPMHTGRICTTPATDSPSLVLGRSATINRRQV